MDSSRSSQPENGDLNVPLAVDLDGTLIRTDVMWESLVRLLRFNPLYALAVLFWWTQRRANLKRQLAARIQLAPGELPFHEAFLDYLRAERARGRRIVLATASDLNMARPVANHTGLFDEVLASDGKKNLRGVHKAYVLRDRFGERGFDYAGNSRPDLAVWAQAREAIVVNASRSLAEAAARVCRLGKTFLEPRSFVRLLLLELRPQRWPKNALVWLPLAALGPRGASFVAAAAWTSLAFCLCAASAYAWNDLLDLDEDRRHPVRKLRPFASGRLPLQAGLAVAPLLALAGLLLGARQSWGVSAVLLAYLAGTVVYTTLLKRAAPLVILGLATLNFLRVLAGVLIVGSERMWPQLWIPAALCAGLAAIRFAFHRR